MLDQAGEVAAWCIGAGIGTLSIYERTGALKSKDLGLANVYKAVNHKLQSYFGSDSPDIKLVYPHASKYCANGQLGNTLLYHEEEEENQKSEFGYSLVVNLLSAEDGRETIVELSRTMGELARTNKLSVNDLTIDLIDGEMKNLVIDEPDLVILFSPQIDLQGFPPWQIRLSEIFHQPDNDEVSYGVFLTALQKYASSRFNLEARAKKLAKDFYI